MKYGEKSLERELIDLGVVFCSSKDYEAIVDAPRSVKTKFIANKKEKSSTMTRSK